MAINDYRLLKAYREFEKKLVQEEIFKDKRVSYPSICKELGVPPKSMDALLLQELGMTGRQLIRSFRISSAIL